MAIHAESVATAETVDGSFASTASIAVPSATLDAAPATGFSAYEILEPIRRFDRGTVYVARHKALDRKVALRVLEGESAADPDVKAGFLQAANACAAIAHPNLAAILEASESDPPFVAEEYFDGEAITGFGPRSKKQIRAEFVFPNRELAGLMLQAAAGLDCLHKNTALAGPLSIDRILVDEHGHLKIVGLGESAQGFADNLSYASLDDHGQDEVRSLGMVFRQVVSGSAALEGDSLLAPAATLNPGLSPSLAKILDGVTLKNSPAPLKRAEDLCVALAEPVRRHVMPITWWPRFVSLSADGLICFVIGVLLIALAGTAGILQQAGEQREVFFLLLLLAGPLAMIALEFAAGWTPSRRLYGFYPVSHTGGRPTWKQSLLRQLSRVGVFALFEFALYLMVELFYASGFLSEGLMTTGLIISGFMITLPAMALALYASSRFTVGKMPVHEVLSGVRLARIEQVSDNLESPSPIATALTTPILDDSAQPETPVEKVDQYELIEIVGAGGMGQVYRARDSVLGRSVAFKVMASRCLTGDVELQRFEREARLAANLSHPNIAKAYGYGRWGTQPYVAIEFIDGPTLQQLIKSHGKMPIAKAWNFIMQAAEGLREADKAGIVHRDIKPSNLIVSKSGTLKVVDFGIARKSANDEGLTRTGTFVGTPRYMSPEQATGKELDCRADIYSLGMTLYHLLAGAAPFDKGNPMEILAQQLSEEPPSLMGKVPGLTDERNAILCKMLAKKRDDRFANYDELLEALHRESPSGVSFAGPFQRFKAELQNAILLGLTNAICLVLTLELLTLFLPSDNNTTVRARFTIFGQIARFETLAIFVGFCLMYIVGIARWGKTFGKWAAGERVLRSDGRRVGWRRAICRLFAVYPALLLMVPNWFGASYRSMQFLELDLGQWALLGNVIWLAASAIYGLRHARCQMLHDRLLDTVVVQTPKLKLRTWPRNLVRKPVNPAS